MIPFYSINQKVKVPLGGIGNYLLGPNFETTCVGAYQNYTFEIIFWKGNLKF